METIDAHYLAVTLTENGISLTDYFTLQFIMQNNWLGIHIQSEKWYCIVIFMVTQERKMHFSMAVHIKIMNKKVGLKMHNLE